MKNTGNNIYRGTFEMKEQLLKQIERLKTEYTATHLRALAEERKARDILKSIIIAQNQILTEVKTK